MFSFSGIFAIIITICLGITYYILNKYFTFDDTKKVKVKRKKEEIKEVEKLVSEVEKLNIDREEFQKNKEKINNFIK